MLRAVGHEDDADGDAQRERRPAGIGGNETLVVVLEHVGSSCRESHYIVLIERDKSPIRG